MKGTHLGTACPLERMAESLVRSGVFASRFLPYLVDIFRRRIWQCMQEIARWTIFTVHVARLLAQGIDRTSQRTSQKYNRKTGIGFRAAPLAMLCTPMVPLSPPPLLAWPGPARVSCIFFESARPITACPSPAARAPSPTPLEHKSLLETRIVVSWLGPALHIDAPHRRAGRRPPNRRRVFSAPWTRKSTRRLASWGGVPGGRDL